MQPGQGAVAFEVTTVKPTDPHEDWLRIEFTPNGFDAHGVMLRELIQEAYGVYEEDRLEGGPAWLKKERFDVQGKIDLAQTPNFRDLSLDQRRSALRSLLAERFGLLLHRETRTLPVYLLTIAKGGTKLREADPADRPVTRVKGYDTLITQSDRGVLVATNFTMSGFATNLASRMGRTVLDRTGLTGHYDVALHWTPDNEPANGVTAQEATSETVWPSLLTALREQLGLKLETGRGEVEVLVVDRAERPSAN